jgi:hypothetical protein
VDVRKRLVEQAEKLLFAIYKSADCIPSFDSEYITVSSAYNKTTISINICRLASSFSFTITSGHPAQFFKWSSNSFKNTENKKGDCQC